MISNGTYDSLKQELEPIYDSLPHDYTHPAWQLPNCIEWSRLALPLARSILGQHVQRVAYNHDYAHELEEGYGLPEGYHAYLVVPSDSDPLVICGTYLQFASSDSQATDHILISRASETPAVLHDAGVVSGSWPYFRADLHFGKTITLAP